MAGAELQPTNGQPPKGNGPFMVQFRIGFISGPFHRDQLRWSDEGSSWCVVAAMAAEKDAQPATWNPKSGGY